MSDEEQTFSFVDKRGRVSDTPAETNPQEAPPAPNNGGAGLGSPAASALPPTGEVAPLSGDGGPSDALPAESEFAQTGDYNEDTEGGQPEIDVYSLLAYCVSLLEAQAWQCLGLIADPQTGDANPDLAQAKVAIDAVGDLAKYLDNAPPDAVPDELRRDLRTLVSNLRLNYVGQQGRTP